MSEGGRGDVIPFFEVEGGGVVEDALAFEFGVVELEVEGFDEKFECFAGLAREA